MCGRTAIATLLLVLLGGGGCAKPIIVDAFNGPARAAAEVATLELDFKVRLIHLDGRPVAASPPGCTSTSRTSRVSVVDVW